MALGCVELMGLWTVAGGSPSLAPRMASVAIAESCGDPSQYNACCHGLWQINIVHKDELAKAGISWNPYDPLSNAHMAVWVYNAQGINAWSDSADKGCNGKGWANAPQCGGGGSGVPSSPSPPSTSQGSSSGVWSNVGPYSQQTTQALTVIAVVLLLLVAGAGFLKGGK